jgi:hypothetical protein
MPFHLYFSLFLPCSQTPVLPRIGRDLIYLNDWLGYLELFISDVQSASYYMHVNISVKHPAVRDYKYILHLAA